MADEEPIFKRVLNKCRHTLVEDLDFESICDYLISKEVFQAVKLRDIKEEKYTSEKNRKIIEAVAVAGVNTYNHFLRGLKFTQQGHLYETLKKNETKLQEKAKKKTKNLTPEEDILHTRVDDSTVPTNAISFTQDIKTSSGASGRGETHELSCDPLQNSSRTTASTPVPSTSQITSKSVEDSASLLILTSGAGAPFESQSSPTLNSLPSLPSSQITPEIVGSNNATDCAKYLPDTGNDEFSRTQAQQALDNIQGWTGEQTASLGNLSSYKDIQKESPTLSATSENGQTGKNQNGMTEIVNNLHITGQRQDQLQHQNTSGSGSHSDMGGVDVTNQTGLPAPTIVSAEQTTSAAPGAPSGKTEATDTELGGFNRLTTTDTSDDYLYLKEHFDACILYTEGNRNRADEILKVIENFPDNFRVCCYDDEEYFGLFTPESHAAVIIQHCVLLLIVIAENLDEDKHAKHVRTTIAMYNQNSAQIRPVLFAKEERKFIPTSLANTRPISWYEKDTEHFKKNLLALLSQCQGYRKSKEQSVKTKKDIAH